MPETTDFMCFCAISALKRRPKPSSFAPKTQPSRLTRPRAISSAKISHDIRTPLNAILGAADLLSGTSLDSDQADYVDMFQRNCRRLVALINDFLDFGRIEAGALQGGQGSL